MEKGRFWNLDCNIENNGTIIEMFREVIFSILINL